MKSTLLVFILLFFFTLNGAAQKNTAEAEHMYFEAMELYRHDAARNDSRVQTAIKQEGKILCYPGIHITSFPIFCINHQGYNYFYVLTFSCRNNSSEKSLPNQLLFPRLAQVQMLKVPVGIHVSTHPQTFNVFWRHPKNLIE